MTETAFLPNPPTTPTPPPVIPKPDFKTPDFRIPLGQAALAALIIYLFNELNKRRCGEQNNETECYAAIPEWWSARPGYSRSQLILHFREKPDGNWKRSGRPSVITIPWAEYPEDGFASPPVDAHIRGKVLGELPLNDNSKIRVFCNNEDEAKRVMAQCVSLVREGYKPSDEEPSIKTMRNDEHFNVKTVFPFKAIYLPTGARQDPANPPKISYFD